MKTTYLSSEAIELLAQGIVDGELLRMLFVPPSAALYREIDGALGKLGWRWDRGERAYRMVPDPVAALAAAIETGEVPA